MTFDPTYQGPHHHSVGWKVFRVRTCTCVCVWVRPLASCMLVTGWDHLINGLMNSPFHRWDELTLLCSLSAYSKSPLCAPSTLQCFIKRQKNNVTADDPVKEVKGVYKRFIFISLISNGFIINCVFWIVLKQEQLFYRLNVHHLYICCLKKSLISLREADTTSRNMSLVGRFSLITAKYSRTIEGKKVKGFFIKGKYCSRWSLYHPQSGSVDLP